MTNLTDIADLTGKMGGADAKAGLDLSIFGEKLSGQSGILDLMNDIGEAVALRPDLLALGGGNPAAIPEMQALWRKSAADFLADAASFDKALVCYDAPQGDPAFLDAFARLFAERFGLPITAKNVAVVSGAQLGAFCLLNLLAGRTRDGRRRKILIPASPEYVGYADMGVEPDLFVACPAKITFPNPDNPQIFKYVVDFDAVERAVAENDVAAILVSRPTNPSGNVLRRNELERLDALAERIGAWLIVDSAYGGPFPGIVEDERELDSVFWGRRTILTFSLSKIGLPGLRTGFVVAPEEIVERLAAITAIVGLANGSLGQRIAKPFFETGEILRASREIVRPFYQRRRAAAVELLGDELRRVGVDGRLHASEGAFFLWLWAPELKSGSKTLYRNLKERGVLAIPGDEFFYGLDGAATDGGDGGVKVGATGKVGQSDGGKAERDPIFEAHRRQMLRISFSAAESVVERGFRIIAETLAETVAVDARNAR